MPSPVLSYRRSRPPVRTFAVAALTVLLRGGAASAGTLQAFTTTDGRQRQTDMITATATNSADEQDTYSRNDVYGTVSADVSASVSAAATRLYGRVLVSCPPGEENQSSVIASTNSSDSLTVGGVAGNVEIAAAIGGSVVGHVGQVVNSASYSAEYRLDLIIFTSLGQVTSINVDQLTSTVGNRNNNSGPVGLAVQPGTQIFFTASQGLSVSATATGPQQSNSADVTADYSHTIRWFAIPLSAGMALSSESGHDYTPLPGDADLNGSVSFSDLLTLAQHYGQSGAGWSEGDLNHDGMVNFSDLLLLAQHYGQGLAVAPADASPVPEAAVMPALAGIALLCRRRVLSLRRRGREATADGSFSAGLAIHNR